jgi:membrane protein DedA with SNARE-associated domain
VSEPDPSAAAAAAARPRHQPPRRSAVIAVGTLIGALIIANNVGSALTTTWAREHPAWLLALNSSNRVLALTTNQLDAVSYYAIGAARLLVADPLFFLLGMWYGDAGIRWVERKWSSQGELLRTIERGFDKAAYPLVFLAPNNIVCLLAGASAMPLGAFFAVNIAGTATRLFLIRQAGEALESPLDGVLDFFEEYRWPLLVLSIVLVGASYLNDRRRGTDELGAIAELEELDEELREHEPREPEGER